MSGELGNEKESDGASCHHKQKEERKNIAYEFAAVILIFLKPLHHERNKNGNRNHRPHRYKYKVRNSESGIIQIKSVRGPEMSSQNSVAHQGQNLRANCKKTQKVRSLMQPGYFFVEKLE